MVVFILCVVVFTSGVVVFISGVVVLIFLVLTKSRRSGLEAGQEEEGEEEGEEHGQLQPHWVWQLSSQLCWLLWPSWEGTQVLTSSLLSLQCCCYTVE